jgi:ketosteroid isomerase-like protein
VAKAVYLEAIRAFNRRDLKTTFAPLSPDCEFQTAAELFEARAFVGAEQVIRFFEEEAFDLLPDWQIEPIHFMQAADDVFVALDRGRGSGRGSGAPGVLDLASVLEFRHWSVVRVHQYPSWELGLRAAGLDPSIAEDARRPASQASRKMSRAAICPHPIEPLMRCRIAREPKGTHSLHTPAS